MNATLLTSIGFLGFFLTGIIWSAFNPTFPFLISDFHLKLGAAGLVFTVRSLGSFGGTLVGGIWSDAVGRKRLVALGAALQAVGFLLIPLTSNWELALLAFLVAGVGSGSQSAGLNALVAEVNPTRRSLALNAVHGLYGIGSLVGPLLAGLLLRDSGLWRPIFFGSAAFWAAFTLISLLPTYPAAGGRAKGSRMAVGPLLLSPLFLLLLTVPFLYNGTATGLVGWITTYAQTEIQLSVMQGASLVSLFYVGLTTGRFICGYVSERIGYARTMLTLSLGVAACYPLVFISDRPWLLGLGILLSGLFFSGLYPTTMAWAAQAYPNAAGTVTGVVSVGMSLGLMVIPPAMGWLGDRYGLGFSMAANWSGTLVLVLVGLALLRLQRRADDSGQSEARSAAR